MRLVIQRVKNTTLKIDNKIYSEIEKGLLVYVCITQEDSEKELEFYSNKISGLRIFEDSQGKMNLSAKEVGGEIMIVSNFSLTADISHGFRPSFSGCAEKEKANNYYLKFIELCKQKSGVRVVTGVFGADMEVTSNNWGPINILV